MNRIIATTGIAALGAAVCQPAVAQEAKPWSVTASVRSFYDDNYTTLPSKAAAGSPTKRSSWGLEFSPEFRRNFNWDGGSLALGSKYGMRYYEDRRENSADHSLELSASGKHQIERWDLGFDESFALSQEPGVLDTGVVTTPLRTSGNNIRNSFKLTGKRDITDSSWFEPSYSNVFYDYEQTGNGSRSALLDRVEHRLALDGRWSVFENTTALAGYAIGFTDHTSNDFNDPAVLVPSRARNSRSHYFYLGGDTKFYGGEMTAALRGGFLYTEYPDAALADAPHALAGLAPFNRSQTSPYVDGSWDWQYGPNRSLQVGVKHARNTSDIAPSLDAESTTMYSSLNHMFLDETVKLGLVVQYQISSFKSVTTGSVQDNFLTSGLNLEWRFHQFISLEGGYNYDRLDADLAGRSYYRNRIYFGLKATW